MDEFDLEKSPPSRFFIGMKERRNKMYETKMHSQADRIFGGSLKHVASKICRVAHDLCVVSYNAWRRTPLFVALRMVCTTSRVPHKNKSKVNISSKAKIFRIEKNPFSRMLER